MDCLDQGGYFECLSDETCKYGAWTACLAPAQDCMQGEADCTLLAECAKECPELKGNCSVDCLLQGTPAAQKTFPALLECLEEKCGSSSLAECLETLPAGACAEQLEACPVDGFEAWEPAPDGGVVEPVVEAVADIVSGDHPVEAVPEVVSEPQVESVWEVVPEAQVEIVSEVVSEPEAESFPDAGAGEQPGAEPGLEEVPAVELTVEDKPASCSGCVTQRPGRHGGALVVLMLLLMVMVRLRFGLVGN